MILNDILVVYWRSSFFYSTFYFKYEIWSNFAVIYEEATGSTLPSVLEIAYKDTEEQNLTMKFTIADGTTATRKQAVVWLVAMIKVCFFEAHLHESMCPGPP